MSTLQQEAEAQGIPFVIRIDYAMRHKYCGALAAELAYIQGEFAFYRGVCTGQHNYTIKRKIKPKKKAKKKELHIENGILKESTSKQSEVPSLEDF